MFRTDCVDAAYYQFPSAKYLEGLVSKVPEDFRFGLKVTDDITLKRFTNLPRFGIASSTSASSAPFLQVFRKITCLGQISIVATSQSV